MPGAANEDRTMFKLEIKTENAAFKSEGGTPDDDTDARASECAGILREAARMVGEGYTSGLLVDSNGNRVGSFSFS
jgi:hypothetical protein